jgi:hypothetical protein
MTVGVGAGVSDGVKASPIQAPMRPAFETSSIKRTRPNPSLASVKRTRPNPSLASVKRHDRPTRIVGVAAFLVAERVRPLRLLVCRRASPAGAYVTIPGLAVRARHD